MKLVATLDGRSEPVEVREEGATYRVTVGDTTLVVDARQPVPGVLSLLVDGACWRAEVAREEDGWVVIVDGERHAVILEEEARFQAHAGKPAAAGGQTLRSPMPGKISHVAVERGSAVQPGDTVLVIEAMKMENEIKASVAGAVREVRVTVGQPVNAGDVLVVIE
jgi:biotin carboxyl carrier protein